jgi:hypothetical protein
MSIKQNHSRGVGSLIGAAFLVLIILTSYSLFLVNTKEQTAYQNILTEMHQRDLEQIQETIEFRRVTTDENGKLQLSLRNNGPRAAHVIYVGVFYKEVTPEIHNYYDVDINIDPSESQTYTSPSIILEEGMEYEIQLVTDAGNTFSLLFTPGTEIYSDIEISIMSSGIWLRDNFPSGYSVITGNYVSGTVPGSVQQIDGQYFLVDSTPTSGDTTTYYPEGFSLLGSTSHISGSISDLTADDGNRMLFESYGTDMPFYYHPEDITTLNSTRIISGDASNLLVDDGEYVKFDSYISATSDTSPSEAFISYRSNDGSGARFPKIRNFDMSWGSEGELPDAGSNIKHVRVAYCTRMERYNERIVVTLSDDRSLDAYVFDGTSWTHTSFGDMDGVDRRPFDIAYEGASGRALVVYANRISDNTKDLSYRIWNGTAWSNEFYLDDPTSSRDQVEYRWISLVTNPTSGSNEVGMIATDRDDDDANAVIWNGSNWVNWQEVTGTVTTPDRECVAIAYEYSTGYLMAVAGEGDMVVWSRFTGSWSTPSTFDINPRDNEDMSWLSLKSHRVSASNRLMLLSLDRATDACAIDWTSSSWGTAERLDRRVETRDRRCLDGDWEPDGTKFVAVAGNRDTDSLSYKTWTPSGGWSPSSDGWWDTFSGLTTDQLWVQVRADPRGEGTAKLFIATLDDGRDLVITTWDGTTMTDQIEVTTNVGTDNTEAFEVAFQLFGDPIEYTGNMEFTGSSNIYDWNELKWTADSSYTTGSVSVTLQLYNFSAGTYPTSGNGYLSYVSSSTPDTDETKLQTITNNPNNFKDANGNWKLRAIVVKATNTPFCLNLDLIEFKPTAPLEICSVEFTGSSNTNAWKHLLWTTDSMWDTGNVEVTLQLYDYSSGDYPDAGDGYVSYESNPIPNIDEKKSTNETATPWKFRDVNGDWKLKITGLKPPSSSYQLGVDLMSYSPTSGADVASTEFTFSGISTNSPLSLSLKLVSDHTEPDVGVDVSLWNYITSSYASSGQGHTCYTSTKANEVAWLNITSGALSFVDVGESRVKITSTYSSSFTQRTNLVKLDYKKIPTALPFNTTGTYTIEVKDEASGEPRPYVSMILFSNGTTIEFEGLINPATVFANEEGTYELNLKSCTDGGENFKLYVLVGSVSAEKKIIQLP